MTTAIPPTTSATSASVRSELVEALRLDLVGPSNDHPFANELLRESPTRWYLTGFLVPSDAPVEQRTDETASDEIDSAGEGDGSDDADSPDQAAARRTFLPSSMGLSVLVDPEVSELHAMVSWGDYVYEGAESGASANEAGAEEGEDKPTESEDDADSADPDNAGAKPLRGFRRVPRAESVTIPLSSSSQKPVEFKIPNSNGLTLFVTIRTVVATALGADRLPVGTRSVSVFLVNRRRPEEKRAYRTFAFQTELLLKSAKSFVARPDLRACTSDEADWDDHVADLQYRDECEYAVGHGVSATAEKVSDLSCFTVSTTWIPTAEVELVAPALIPDVELKMEALSTLSSGAEATALLSPLVSHYRAWIDTQRQRYQGLDPQRMETINDLLIEAGHVATRIEKGIELLAQPDVLEAFRLANRTMAKAARQREAVQRQTDPAAVAAPQWRPFQLAFFLMTLRSIVDPQHSDRERVDLLFFPTGGGKTEAYLALAAFTMVLRRLRNPGIRSAGLSVLMRYTLRLLTLDQLGRAAALMCALELEREQDARLGEWPFEIGLWVGSAATPNRMGKRGYTGPGREYTAYVKTTHFQRDDRKPSPIPIENCPWCGEKFNRNSFRLVPTPDNPIDLRVHCANHNCEFSGDRSLPILGVDEPIYRRLPAFLIATVDKFAALPWTGETGTLFGLVDRYDKDGFYGPCKSGVGSPLDGGPLPPPDLIIQDELHLISGPLGTIAGVYETAIDALSTREVEGHKVRPKIIASTATVRRADKQIRALFDRQLITVFPPPGPDRRDSFFAQTQPSTETPARMYVGVAAQGRSLKVVLLRSALALLGAAQVAYEREGGKRNKTNPADPYMTLVGYFNSLRELGGSRRIIEDEVRTRLGQYSRRKRREPDDRLFTDRNISYEVLELTSRVPTNEVAGAKRRLALRFHEDERVDVALATNMISVGLDIIRLGLMVVLGQPKMSAEYIQATSRVGRDPERPGLIVTLLNVHKPRDRSHYERFENYHASFYRGVEATSVTPFSPRALDRALPAALVGLCRLGMNEITPSLGATEILSIRGALTPFAERFAERAANHQPPSDPERAQGLRDGVLARCNSLLDDWLNIAEELSRTNTNLKYQQWEDGSAARLLYDFLDPELLQLAEVRKHFRVSRSMRDVEPSVDLTVKNLNDWKERK
jgi:helicase-like protein